MRPREGYRERTRELQSERGRETPRDREGGMRERERERGGG